MSNPCHTRWIAGISYQTDAGPIVVDHGIEELEELADLVEAGPHWDSIRVIVITRGRDRRPGFTIEDAENE